MKLNFHGFSLIDAMLLTLGSMLIAMATISIFSVNQKSDEIGENSQKLVDLIDANVLEINTRPFDQMPAVGSCWVRLYDEKLQFTSEVKTSITSTSCVDKATSGYKVVWKSSDPGAYTFSHPNFMKIPQLTGGIRQIQITGTMKIHTFEKILSLTLLKEKKQ
ncbi:MAG: hypothetical protein A4S09_10725 [Proteobacteria bacterium SG_bin7]|nr:MAG: hypothetical protein A4S09_10725 [Proteobacteria bacterium SG_bin7]